MLSNQRMRDSKDSGSFVNHPELEKCLLALKSAKSTEEKLAAVELFRGALSKGAQEQMGIEVLGNIGLTDQDGRVRLSVVNTLKGIQHPSAVKVLCQMALLDPSDDVRSSAVIALRNCKDPKAIKTLCRIALVDNKFDIRRKAAYALTGDGDVGNFVNSADPQVKNAINSVLRSLLSDK